MQDACRNCLAQEKCDITGGVCQKMDALFAQRKSVTNGRKTMTTPKNSATPKTVTEAVEKQALPAEENTVPAQKAASPKVEMNTDRVVDHTNKILFAGTPSEIVDWLNQHSTMIYAIRLADHPDLITSVDYVKKHQKKISLVQRIKASADKLKKNRKAMLILGASAVVAGLAVKNSRKVVVKVEDVDSEDTAIDGDIPDSL
jgi:phenylpyruvate tautomerase PptA (4-oxalocrotonate tautomerase family)